MGRARLAPSGPRLRPQSAGPRKGGPRRGAPGRSPGVGHPGSPSSGCRSASPACRWPWRPRCWRRPASTIHPHVLSVYDYGVLGREESRWMWMAVELASGGALTTWQPQRWDDVEPMLSDVLSGLAHAHARGMVHRDLKPANLLRSSNYDLRPGLKIGDFGLATVRGVEQAVRRGARPCTCRRSRRSPPSDPSGRAAGPRLGSELRARGPRSGLRDPCLGPAAGDRAGAAPPAGCPPGGPSCRAKAAHRGATGGGDLLAAGGGIDPRSGIAEQALYSARRYGLEGWELLVTCLQEAAPTRATTARFLEAMRYALDTEATIRQQPTYVGVNVRRTGRADGRTTGIGKAARGL